MSKILHIVFVSIALFLPAFAGAHEMYVLPPPRIDAGMMADSPNPFGAIAGNEYQFLFWGFIAFILVATIALSTFFRVFEKTSAPFFHYLKRFALPLIRAGVGACLISFGYHGALFGPEFPLVALFGSGSYAAEILLMILGGTILAGFAVRYAATALIILWLYAAMVFGVHILNYTNFLGAFIALLILGAGAYSIDHATGAFSAIRHRMIRHSQIALPIVRITFGFGVAFAAVYAKYIHSQLALEVVTMYNLTNFFPFDPLFVVLGALIIEFLAGLMLFFGVAIRWTGLFLLFWLTLSQMYFTEAVWPHLILFFIGLALFAHGYDRYSLEGRFFKRKGLEPVL